jgi:hypothetical protein
MKNSDISNYADDNTISAYAKSITELINKLQSESNIAIKWFRDNETIVNPDKFQFMILDKNIKQGPLNLHTLKLDGYEIESKNSVDLLGIEIDDKITFDNHIHTLTRNAAGQLNYLIWKKHCLIKMLRKY